MHATSKFSRTSYKRRKTPTTADSYYRTRPQKIIGAPNSLYNARANGVEKKYLDIATSIGSTGWTTNTGSIRLLNAVTQGTDFTQRIGRTYTIVSVQYRCTMISVPDENNSSQQVRMLIVYDKQNNSATPDINQILTDTTTIAPMNLNNKDRFIILSDKIIRSCTDGQNLTYLSEYKKCSLTVQNSNVAGTAADIATGAIWLVIINDATVAANKCTLNVVSRTRFKDA